jgi:S-(hydroxymethyl)glutathione dehydrogenase/alcohol dehydrogenase
VTRKVKAALVFTPGQPHVVREVELADPGPGEVLIRLLAMGLCHSDLHALRGNAAPRFPAMLGHEGVGDVVAVGAGVSEFLPGDRAVPYLVPDCGKCAFCRSGRTNLCVQFMARRQADRSLFSLEGQPLTPFMGLGTFAEMTVVPADMLVKVNPAARIDHVCCIGCGVTTGLGAALIVAKITPGSTVAVFGAGGVGLSVIQGARIAGARQIIAVDTNPARSAVASKLGATDFIDPKEVDNVVATIMGLTDSGVDFAFECVGIPSLARQAFESTHPAWGLSVCVGAMPPGSELTIAPLSLMTGRHWTGSLIGGARRQDVARFVDMYMSGAFSLDAFVSHHLTHDQIDHGFAMMQSGEAVRSVVLYPSS